MWNFPTQYGSSVLNVRWILFSLFLEYQTNIQINDSIKKQQKYFTIEYLWFYCRMSNIFFFNQKIHDAYTTNRKKKKLNQ